MCSIRDFCRGGLLLAADAGQPGLEPARRDDQVFVHFTLTQEGVPKHFRVQAKVARADATGHLVGVFFPGGMDASALSALGRFANVDLTGPGAKRPDSTDPRVSAESARVLRQQLRDMMQRALPRLARAFLERADKDLLLKARDSGSNQMQNLLFEAMSLLERRRQAVEEAFGRVVLKQFDEVQDPEMVVEQRRRQTGADGSGLALVDTDVFEEWLAVAEIIAKAEARAHPLAHEMRLRMGCLAFAWGHKEVNPMSPAVIFRGLSEALSSYDISKDVRRELFRSMQESVIPLLRNLYASINKMLEESGALPKLEELEPKPKRNAPPPPGQPATGAGATAPGQAATAGAPGAPNPAFANTLVSQGPLGGVAAGWQTPGAPASVQAAMGATLSGLTAGGAAPPLGTGAGATAPQLQQAVAQGAFNPGIAGWGDQAYRAARELLDLGRRATGPSSVLDAAAREVAAPGTQPFAPQELLGALSDLQRRGVVAGTPLRQQMLDRLRRQPGNDTRGLAPHDRDALQVVESLVASINQDHLVTDGVRNWVKRLEVTLAKLAATDPTFLNSSANEPHAAIDLLNQLAKLGNQGDERDGIDRDIGKRVDELMSKIISDFDGNQGVIGDALGELLPLVDRQTRAYRGNVERTVRQSEGQQKLINARRAVLSELEQRLADRSVPDLLLEVLSPGWRNLLVHAHLRHGPESEQWRSHLTLVDRLMGALTPGAAVNERESAALMDDVRGGLESIAFDPARRETLSKQLDTVLRNHEQSELPRKDLTKEKVAVSLGLESALPEPDVVPEGKDATERDRWREALTAARRLQVGDWVALTEDGGKPRIVTVAFVADDHANIVLVNRKGIKVKELTLRQTVTALLDGTLTVLDEFELPLMERATHRMLQNMHNQLSYLSTHDELTGLINRREFEKRLEKLISQTQVTQQVHALLYVDLDQFKIVNNTGGHATGDALLKEVANTLKHELRGFRSTLARMGGDEFGILLERATEGEALAIADKQMLALRAMRFESEGRVYTISASMGLVVISNEGDAAQAMREADAACIAAKEGGRNRVQVFKSADVGMAKRYGAMQWTVQIDKALAENRLVLNCQRIVPIRPDPAAETHFEVLLSMVDQAGVRIPPLDFITAAESYNRMAAVDRWVITNALQWMGNNRQFIEGIGGFSLNVSGDSMNDEDFVDFVLRAFSQSRVPTGKVCFEVTETSAIANIDSAISFINKMKLIGCKFSLDDFGTGLSSYSYLRNLPVDFIKIDGVFVKEIERNPGDYAVVKSINEIAHFMGKKTIAEYVESQTILDQLLEIGVDYAQGYAIGRPAPLESRGMN